MKLTDRQIRTLRIYADAVGDLRLAMICAFLDSAARTGADSGSEADVLLSSGITQDEARAECARILAAGGAMAECAGCGRRLTSARQRVDEATGDILCATCLSDRVDFYVEEASPEEKL